MKKTTIVILVLVLVNIVSVAINIGLLTNSVNIATNNQTEKEVVKCESTETGTLVTFSDNTGYYLEKQ